MCLCDSDLVCELADFGLTYCHRFFALKSLLFYWRGVVWSGVDFVGGGLVLL